MFASLKNKIKEETGNDPTARVTSSSSRERQQITDTHAGNRIVSQNNLDQRMRSDRPSLSSRRESSFSSIEDVAETSNPFDSTVLGQRDGIDTRPLSVDDCDASTLKETVVEKSNSDTIVHSDQDHNNEEQHSLPDEFERKVDTDNKLQRIKLQLIEAKHQTKEANKMCELLTQDLTSERRVNAELRDEVVRLHAQLGKKSTRIQELGTSLERELQEKDVILLRNAQLNQDIEMSKQESRSQEQDTSELQSRLVALETTIVERERDLASQGEDNEALRKKLNELESADFASASEQELRRKVTLLEDQLAEKVKSIRVLQQHLNDLKKTLQRELKQNGEEPADNGAATLPTAMPTKYGANNDTDVNFKYLKHVIMKFLTSREYEAQHLTRAVSTLLRFSPEEERLLRDTLEWKMSWFGTRPRLGFGQTSKTIPPS